MPSDAELFDNKGRYHQPVLLQFYLKVPRMTLIGSSSEDLQVAGSKNYEPGETVEPAGVVLRLRKTRRSKPNCWPIRKHLPSNSAGGSASQRRGLLLVTGDISDVDTAERQPDVMVITSNVTGDLAEGRNAFDA